MVYLKMPFHECAVEVINCGFSPVNRFKFKNILSRTVYADNEIGHGIVK